MLWALAPIIAQGQVIGLTASKPNPIVCIGADGKPRADGISIEAHPSFHEAPYSSWPPEQYELHLYLCPQDKRTCFGQDGKPVWKNWLDNVQPCDNRNCGKWPIALKPPRATTVWFGAYLKKKGGNWITGDKIGRVVWTNTGQRCPDQPPPPPAPTGTDPRASISWNKESSAGGYAINANGSQGDSSLLTGNFFDWHYDGRDRRNNVTIHCDGGLLPGRQPRAGADGTMTCQAVSPEERAGIAPGRPRWWSTGAISALGLPRASTTASGRSPNPANQRRLVIRSGSST